MNHIKLHGIPVPTESHTLITGVPGSGKTRSVLKPLVELYLGANANSREHKAGMLLIDVKGELVSWTRDILSKIGRSEDLVVIGEQGKGFNLFAQLPLSPTQAAIRLCYLAGSVYRSPSWKRRKVLVGPAETNARGDNRVSLSL